MMMRRWTLISLRDRRKGEMTRTLKWRAFTTKPRPRDFRIKLACLANLNPMSGHRNLLRALQPNHTPAKVASLRHPKKHVSRSPRNENHVRHLAHFLKMKTIAGLVHHLKQLLNLPY